MARIGTVRDIMKKRRMKWRKRHAQEEKKKETQGSNAASSVIKADVKRGGAN